MATAREQLFDDVIALMATTFGDDSDKKIRDLLKKYRVQTKPGVKIPDERTARDALGDRIVELWNKPPPKDQREKVIGDTIDEFRMQAKGRAAKATKKPAAGGTAPTKKMSSPSPAPRPSSKPVFDDEDDDLVIPTGGAQSEPAVRGGPRRRGKTRSECPKCKSMGVVLARSYAGDEYFSCIYCGWQAFKPVDEDDPNSSLAVRLLGRAATPPTKK